MHDLDIGAIRRGEKSKAAAWHELKGMGRKARRQIVKDYVAFPALSGRRGFKSTLTANLTANVIRNVWAYMIIFCGHFPDQTYTFTEDEVAGETRGAFYVRQMLGSANIDGSALFHVMSGNLGHQVEHHLFPDMPSSRYAEIAPRVKDLCERYALPYNTGPLFKQLGTVQRTILRLAFPGGSPRPKPGALPRRATDPRHRRSTASPRCPTPARPARTAPDPSNPPTASASPCHHAADPIGGGRPQARASSQVALAAGLSMTACGAIATAAATRHGYGRGVRRHRHGGRVAAEFRRRPTWAASSSLSRSPCCCRSSSTCSTSPCAASCRRTGCRRGRGRARPCGPGGPAGCR